MGFELGLLAKTANAQNLRSNSFVYYKPV